ncbi:MAG: B12-binding domain-containing radical SAM protein [Anaerolineaceae bacterium]
MNLLMIYPEFPDTFWSFKHALKFVNKKVSNPPLGLMTVAALLPEDWKKKLIDTNVTPLTEELINWADLVFISAMDIQRKSAEELITRVKAKGKKLVAGGPLFTEDYEQFPQVDYLVLNEGEITLPLFLKDFSAGTAQHIYKTDTFVDMSLSPTPDLSLIELANYDCMSIQFSRGCPFRCDFCNVTALLGHKSRVKSAAQIIAELDQLYAAGWRRNIFFVDDNFIGNKQILREEILPALIQWRKGKVGCLFLTEVSINLADDNDLMDLFVQAGFISVFIGVETPDEESLKNCNKGQNTKRDLIENIHKIQQAGIQVMAGFIVGFDSDTPTIFDRMVDFIQKSGIATAMVGLLQAPNKTELYHRLEQQGRIIKEMTGDNTDGTSNIIPLMDAKILRDGYLQIMDQIYSPKYFYKRVKTFLRNYNPAKANVTIEWSEVAALFKTVIIMGFNPRVAPYYWDLFIWTLFHFPAKFPMAITLTVYEYHFHKVAKQNRKAILHQKQIPYSIEGLEVPI